MGWVSLPDFRLATVRRGSPTPPSTGPQVSRKGSVAEDPRSLWRQGHETLPEQGRWMRGFRKVVSDPFLRALWVETTKGWCISHLRIW